MWRNCTAAEGLRKLARLDCSTRAVPASVSSNHWLVRRAVQGWAVDLVTYILRAASLYQADIYIRSQLAWGQRDRVRQPPHFLCILGYMYRGVHGSIVVMGGK